jgi:lipid-binding SYLF domain-containing protein
MSIDRRTFARRAGLGAVALLVLRPASAQPSEQQVLVDRARIVVDEFLADTTFGSLPVYVQNAFAVMVFPDLLKAGFFVGAEYGRGVLLARDVRSGSWSDPAFYDLFGGSLGLQFGGKASDVIFTIMNEGALNKVLTSQFKLGTDASVAAGPLGAGVGAATTLQFGEDVYVFARGKGLYGGLGVDGTYFRPLEDWNRAYYGRPVSVAEIVRGQASATSGTGELRTALARF